MTDRITKALLLAVAVGLWANVGTEWLKPVSVQASGTESQEISSSDRTFRRAVERVVEECSISGDYVDGGVLTGAYVDDGYVYGGVVSGGYVYGGGISGGYVYGSQISC